MATTPMIQVGGSRRQRLFVAANVVVLVLAVVVIATQIGQVGADVVRLPDLWIMTGLAALAGTQAFVSATPRGAPPMIICPTICFSFAILLCWGLLPAIVAQALAVTVVVWRLKARPYDGVVAAAKYVLAFAAAAVILWVGQPDPFQRHGPTNVLTDALSVVGAVAAWLAMFALVSVVLSRLRTTRPPARQITGSVGNHVLFNAALLLLSPVIAVTAHVNVGFLPLVFVPLYAVQRMARLSADRDRAVRVDPLTGLANRTGLRTSFDELAAEYAPGAELRGHGQRPTLFMLDLDRFKHVNDALGHDVGDQLLIAVARRLAAIPIADGTIARLGGDEFAIVAPTTGAGDAGRLARAVVHALAEPVSLQGLRVDVTASVGFVVHTDEDFATLMRHADVAMYEAKKRGNSVASYTSGADQNSPERLGLLTDFRDVLESGDREQISMHYQPQVSLTGDTVEGVEALLRWTHPEYGPINTQDLLTVAEHSAVMQLLTHRVIDDVTAQLASWNADGIRLRASLNVSARDLYCNDVVSHLAERLAHHRVAPGQVQVEITESALLADPARAAVTVHRIAALGVAVSLDDFGTGYSSLQHLRKLPISELKIDRSFVNGMADNRDDAAIVRSTVELARSLGIRTVAEGVETEYTRRLLAEIGCTLAQGWHTGYPMPGRDFARWLSATVDTTPAVATARAA